MYLLDMAIYNMVFKSKRWNITCVIRYMEYPTIIRWEMRLDFLIMGAWIWSGMVLETKMMLVPKILIQIIKISLTLFIWLKERAVRRMNMMMINMTALNIQLRM